MERLRPGHGTGRNLTRLALVIALTLVPLGAACGRSGGYAASPTPTVSSEPDSGGIVTAASARDVGISPGHSVYNLSEAPLDRLFALFRNMGMSWIRVDLNWSRIESQPGQFDWTEPDRVIHAARRHGLNVLPVLCYGPDWATKVPGSGTPPDDPTSIANFARAGAARYGPLGVDTWEIWNEANLVDFWAPSPNATAYGRLLTAANAAIKSAQPSATVLVTGLAGLAQSRVGGNIAALVFLRSLYDGGFGDSFDGVAAHPYTYPKLASDGPNAFTRLSRLRALMVARGDGHKQIWITETGAPTGTARGAVSQSRQAAILVDVVEQAHRQDWIKLVLIYGGIDSGTDRSDREQNFGFLKSDFAPKRAYGALVRELARPE